MGVIIWVVEELEEKMSQKPKCSKSLDYLTPARMLI